MENLDILQFIKKSFAEKNLFSFFLISIVSFALILFIGIGMAFYYRAHIFEYFAKEYLLGG